VLCFNTQLPAQRISQPLPARHPLPPRSKFNPHAWQCGFPHPPRKCGYLQPSRVKPLRAGL